MVVFKYFASESRAELAILYFVYNNASAIDRRLF